jgi:hypothetical protein
MPLVERELLALPVHPMTKRKRTKEQTMIYKTPHRKRTSNTNLTKNQR